MTLDRSHIRVTSMLVAPNDDVTARAVSLNRPTAENPEGYHRLIGGGIEPGESHREAIVREVDEELGATIRGLTFLTTIENIFSINGTLGHEIVFLHVGRLDPLPALRDAFLTETDGTVVPVVWRSFGDAHAPLPLYPSAAVAWVRSIADPRGGPS